jgi:hypothetical protein
MQKDENKYGITVVVANESHLKYAEEICKTIEDAAKVRGTGIAKREPEYIREKIRDGKSVIALTKDGKFAGYCYIESWGADKDFVANSGLIVKDQFRGLNLGKTIKDAAFQLSRRKFPMAKMFGITTSPAVMKINYSLGYRPVTFDHLTDDDEFWKGCESCVNYDILTRTGRRHCLCTAMLFDPNEHIKIKKAEEVDNEKEISLSL